MPQLWTETIVTQYFWLIVILLAFYYITVTQLIPQIANTLKTRKALENSIESLVKETEATLIYSAKALLSKALSPNLNTFNTPEFKTPLIEARKSWINKHIS